jgi:hypothetical protein
VQQGTAKVDLARIPLFDEVSSTAMGRRFAFRASQRTV